MLITLLGFAIIRSARDKMFSMSLPHHHHYHQHQHDSEVTYTCHCCSQRAKTRHYLYWRVRSVADRHRRRRRRVINKRSETSGSRCFLTVFFLPPLLCAFSQRPSIPRHLKTIPRNVDRSGAEERPYLRGQV